MTHSEKFGFKRGHAGRFHFRNSRPKAEVVRPWRVSPQFGNCLAAYGSGQSASDPRRALLGPGTFDPSLARGVGQIRASVVRPIVHFFPFRAFPFKVVPGGIDRPPATSPFAGVGHNRTSDSRSRPRLPSGILTPVGLPSRSNGVGQIDSAASAHSQNEKSLTLMSCAHFLRAKESRRSRVTHSLKLAKDPERTRFL